MTNLIWSNLPEWMLRWYLRIRKCFRVTTADRERARRDAIYDQLGRPVKIPQGPFQGLIFVPWLRGRWLPELLGVYEKEIWPAIEAICELGPDIVVNIGAANGYYAAGFARRIPTAKIIAFEGERSMRRILRQTIQANEVDDRVCVRGWCDLPALASCLSAYGEGRAIPYVDGGGHNRVVVVCDCEGMEKELLDPSSVSWLQDAFILVELHDHLCEGVSEQLRQRFSASHDIEEFQVCPSRVSDLPDRIDLPKEDALFAIEQHRGIDAAPIWFMRPKTKSCRE